LRGLLACGLKNERLGLVLEQYLTHERLRDDLRRRVWSALAYPAVLMLLLTAWCYFAGAVLLPDIADIMDSFGIELPVSTQLTFAIGKYLPRVALVAGIFIVAALVVSRFGWHVPGVAVFCRYLPVIGRLGRYRAMIEFSDLLGLLAGEKVPMPTA